MIIFERKLFNRVDPRFKNKLQIYKRLSRRYGDKFNNLSHEDKLSKINEYLLENKDTANYLQEHYNNRRNILKNNPELSEAIAKNSGRLGLKDAYNNGVFDIVEKNKNDLANTQKELKIAKRNLNNANNRTQSVINKTRGRIKDALSEQAKKHAEELNTSKLGIKYRDSEINRLTGVIKDNKSSYENKIKQMEKASAFDKELANRLHQDKINYLKREHESAMNDLINKGKKETQKFGEKEFERGKSEVGVLRGLKNSWGRTSKLGKAGIIGAGAAALGGGVYLAGRHMGYWGNKKNRR